MADVQWDLLANLGDKFSNSYDKARKRQQDDRLIALQEQELQAPGETAKILLGSMGGGGNVQSPAAVPAAPGAPRLPSFAGGSARMAAPPEAFAPLIKRAAAEHGIDEGMLTRQLAKESAFAPDVIDGTRRSSAGAMGIAQFMPGTAKRFGINPLDPSQAIPAAARYVAENRKLLGNDGLAIAGYNWGEGNVQRWLASGADPRAVPAETRDYVAKITGKPIEAWAGAGRVASAPAAAEAAAPAGFQGDSTGRIQAMLQSKNPFVQKQGVALATQLFTRSDSWKLEDIGEGQKGWVNGTTRQVVALPVDPVLHESRKQEKIETARAGAIRVNDGVEDRLRAVKTMRDRGIPISAEEEKHFVTDGKGLPVAAPKEPKAPTEDERKNRQLLLETARELPIAIKSYSSLTEASNQLATRLLPESVSGFATSEGYQRAHNSVSKIVASYLYSVSGATANPGEVKTLTDGLMPKPGEKPLSLTDKRARLQTMVEAIKLRANEHDVPAAPAAPKLPDGVTAEQAVAEARKAVSEGKDPAQVKARLLSFGIKTDSL